MDAGANHPNDISSHNPLSFCFLIILNSRVGNNLLNLILFLKRTDTGKDQPVYEDFYLITNNGKPSNYSTNVLFIKCESDSHFIKLDSDYTS
jgi:hypothetical protein